MPREPTSLLVASRLRIGEDRLTELVAVAVQANVGFARALLIRAGIDPHVAERVTRVRALTQTWTPRGRRPDMEVLGYRHDALVCRVWCEHKIGALYQPDQLEDYSADLAAMPGATVALLTVVTRIGQAPPGSWHAATWADVAADAVALIRTACGVRWRSEVWRPETAARLLVLAELLTYLDRELDIVSEPLTSADILVFAGSSRAYDTLDALLRRAAQLCGEPMSGDVDWNDAASAGWVLFNASDADWWMRYDGYPELHLADSDTYFGQQRRGEPAFGVGISLPPGYGETIFAERTAWIATLRRLRIDPYPDHDVLRLYRTVYLAETLVAGVTLEEQARWVADRMAEALRDLRAAAPDGELTVPPKRGRRQRAEPHQADVADTSQETI